MRRDSAALADRRARQRRQRRKIPGGTRGKALRTCVSFTSSATGGGLLPLPLARRLSAISRCRSSLSLPSAARFKAQPTPSALQHNCGPFRPLLVPAARGAAYVSMAQLWTALEPCKLRRNALMAIKTLYSPQVALRSGQGAAAAAPPGVSGGRALRSRRPVSCRQLPLPQQGSARQDHTDISSEQQLTCSAPEAWRTPARAFPNETSEDALLPVSEPTSNLARITFALPTRGTTA